MKSRDRIDAKCDCGNTRNIAYYAYKLNITKNGKYLCASCAAKLACSEEVKNRISNDAKNRWKQDSYVKKQSVNHKKAVSLDGYRLKRSDIAKNMSQETKQLISQNMRNHWKLNKEEILAKRPNIKEQMAYVSQRNKKVSKVQQRLYDILDGLGVKYFKERNDGVDDTETKVGPWSFDCAIPTDNKTLLIEVQGDYWHNLDVKKRNDRAKHTYINTYFTNTHELKYIWEHEFFNYDMVASKIKYWLKLDKIDVIDFKFDNVVIKKILPQHYKEFLELYHYIPGTGRGGIAYGAYFGSELVAICVFSPVVRQNVNIDGCEQNKVRELSRLCIHPRYQKKNFASWFISRTLKLLSGFEYVISYCDTTFNHNGAVYKACNFVLDGEVKPDYWYVNGDGWVIHKKKVYNHAVRMKKTEKQWASENGFTKVYGNKKLRFTYKLN